MSRLLISLTILAMINISLATVCKDGSSCPGTTTCCLTPRGVGCCQFTNANCCGDGLHCCPSGYYCNASSQCVKKADTNEFLAFLSVNPLEEETMKAVATTPSVPEAAPADLIKCLEDIRPVVKDVETLYEDIKKGDKEAAEQLLLKLAAEGVTLVQDCAKLFA
jgi:hypothetical protein